MLRCLYAVWCKATVFCRRHEVSQSVITKKKCYNTQLQQTFSILTRLLAATLKFTFGICVAENIPKWFRNAILILHLSLVERLRVINIIFVKVLREKKGKLVLILSFIGAVFVDVGKNLFGTRILSFSVFLETTAKCFELFLDWDVQGGGRVASLEEAGKERFPRWRKPVWIEKKCSVV